MPRLSAIHNLRSGVVRCRDSHAAPASSCPPILDPVDERQRALALELAGREARKHDFQYICALNSDMIPWKDFSPDFDLDEFVRLRLTDATDDGCLLGIRF